MLRVARLARELNQEFDVAVACESAYDAETLASNWDSGRPFREVVSVPNPVPDPRRDALWGSAPAVVKSTLLTLVPNRPPRIYDWSRSERLIEETRLLLKRVPVDVVWAHKTWTAEVARAAGAERIIV